MNNYQQIIKQLVEASPSWEKDGGGIRGRTIAPLLSGLSSNGGMAEFIPQQFNQSNNEAIQRSAQDPIADLILGGGGGGGVATPSHPFKITLSSIPNSENFTIRVNAGTINNVLAGNWQSEGTSSGSAVYVVLTVSTSANQVISSSMSFDSSPPAGEPTPVRWAVPSQFKVLLGIVIESNVFQIAFNNMFYNALKRVTTEKSNPQAGLLPYDNWYTWIRVSG